jgi:hypothetical protein
VRPDPISTIWEREDLKLAWRVAEDIAQRKVNILSPYTRAIYIPWDGPPVPVATPR